MELSFLKTTPVDMADNRFTIGTIDARRNNVNSKVI